MAKHDNDDDAEPPPVDMLEDHGYASGVIGTEPCLVKPEHWAARLARMDAPARWALFWELVRFGWVGVATAVLYAAQMWVLSRVTHWPTWLNAAVADGPCLLFNYTMHRSFSFRSQRRHAEAGPRYLAVQLTGFGINSGVLWYSVDHMRWPFLPTQLGAIVVLAAFSYVVQKLWSF